MVRGRRKEGRDRVLETPSSATPRTLLWFLGIVVHACKSLGGILRLEGTLGKEDGDALEGFVLFGVVVIVASVAVVGIVIVASVAVAVAVAAELHGLKGLGGGFQEGIIVDVTGSATVVVIVVHIVQFRKLCLGFFFVALDGVQPPVRKLDHFQDLLQQIIVNQHRHGYVMNVIEVRVQYNSQCQSTIELL